MHTNNTGTGPNPSGLCQCGCGGTAPIARQSLSKTGDVRGEPLRFIKGHQTRGRRKPGPLYVVDPETGCWVWQRKITHGYAYITINKQTLRAARYFYEEHVGPIPEGLTIDHTCRNRACVNPAHLEPVTITENIRRKPTTKMTEEGASEVRRLSHHMTQRELADLFGVHQSSISRILGGKTWR